MSVPNRISRRDSKFRTKNVDYIYIYIERERDRERNTIRFGIFFEEKNPLCRIFFD